MFQKKSSLDPKQNRCHALAAEETDADIVVPRPALRHDADVPVCVGGANMKVLDARNYRASSSDGMLRVCRIRSVTFPSHCGQASITARRFSLLILPPRRHTELLGVAEAVRQTDARISNIRIHELSYSILDRPIVFVQQRTLQEIAPLLRIDKAGIAIVSASAIRIADAVVSILVLQALSPQTKVRIARLVAASIYRLQGIL